MKGKDIDPNYSVEVSLLDKDRWSEILASFTDSNIYQTWSYGALLWGEKNLSHVILKNEDGIVAAAQCRIIKIGIGLKSIYLNYGPLWHLKGKEDNLNSFRMMIRAIIQEYGIKRGYFVRVKPNEMQSEDGTLSKIIAEEGMLWKPEEFPYRTIVNDLTPPLDDLLMGLKKKWREKLRRAQRNGLDIVEGTDSRLFAQFIKLYREMHSRKKFAEFHDINQYREIQSDLPDRFKMNVILCKHGEEPVAGLVWSAIGETGTSIFSATGHKGLKLYGSYLLRWRMVERLKEAGCRFFDQGGINKQNNPGGYHFKAGMGGSEITYIGQFDYCRSNVKHAIMSFADALRVNVRRLKISLAKLRQRK